MMYHNDDYSRQPNIPVPDNFLVPIFWVGFLVLMVGIIFLGVTAWEHEASRWALGSLAVLLVALQKRVPGPIGYPGATGAVGCRGEPGKDASSTLVDQLVECLYGSRISGMGFEDRSSARRIAAAVHFVEKQQWNLAHPSPPQPAAHPGPGKGRPSRPGGKRK